eukprot:12918327-Prorocentrum_lima.AAC.1
MTKRKTVRLAFRRPPVTRTQRDPQTQDVTDISSDELPVRQRRIVFGNQRSKIMSKGLPQEDRAT